MGESVTLEKVQELKEKALMSLMNSGTNTDAEIDEYLKANRYQVLDILDDALYAHKEGKF